MSNNLIEYTFCNSTAEDERNYFSGNVVFRDSNDDESMDLKEGLYRVVDGELFRVS